MTAIDFVDVHDLGDALEVLEERGADATVLAGGTDLVSQLLRREIRPRALVHIRNVTELRGIRATERTEIGATTTHWELMSSTPIQVEHRALAEAAATVGGRQTQNVGTIAGNVVNASPAADLMPALLVGNADVSVSSASGSRTLPLDQFVIGRKQTALEPNELVTSITLERPGRRTGEAYLKVGRRNAMEVAIVGLAARLSFDESDAITEARIALCSVGPTAFRVPEVESTLVGTRADDQAVADAQRLLEASAQPIDDVRGSAAYRRRVLASLLQGAIQTCAKRAQSPPTEG